MAAHPFVIVPSLAAIAVAYSQSGLIADQVLPRVPVSTEVFRYLNYGSADAFQAPDTTVGRKSAPNQIDWAAAEKTDQVQDQALDTPVPNADIVAWERAHEAGPGFVSAANPLERATALVMQSVLNRREYRAANLVFNNASYGANNKVALAGTSQWSDFANSDPLTAILTSFDGMLMRPNIGVLGRATATKLRTHPKICKAVFGYNTDAGVVPLKALADLLELEDLYVGDAWINTAAPGQQASMTRAWGKHAAFLCRNKQADTRAGVTFGVTAQYGPRIGGTIQDPDIGARGGVRVRSGESVKELVTAGDLGYFFQNAVN
ncbi:hypothetical protein [Pelomonas aquatica]|jgi:hypothetical protein|uniref:Phage capsid protein n=1 Tax=Pelomonas aquatica TaxID=431058 RepID=A0A9X4LCK2_9BURK|nr:hypothetical protein [Pelomonas aquatica]MCY4753266.1 hypothetical protein [Pelomonas aquatica]MDG0861346.1 phage capsid protein [Pelomonas aquatica]